MILIPQGLDCNIQSNVLMKTFCFLIQLFYRFKNKPNMNFDDTSIEADQEFELYRDNTGTIEYPTK
jgi:hypothetical protein